MGASFLSAANLTNWIAKNDEEYIRRALQLGANEIRGYKEKVEYMKKLNELEV